MIGQVISILTLVRWLLFIAAMVVLLIPHVRRGVPWRDAGNR